MRSIDRLMSGSSSIFCFDQQLLQLESDHPIDLTSAYYSQFLNSEQIDARAAIQSAVNNRDDDHHHRAPPVDANRIRTNRRD